MEQKPKVSKACELCGQDGWCGRPCVHDPSRSNGLLFHASGRLRTLRQRGFAAGRDLVASARRPSPSEVDLTRPLRAASGRLEAAAAALAAVTSTAALGRKKRGSAPKGGRK